jgi:ABC-type branched-subunit amino acid transport system substrate-binding protein
LRNGKLTKLLAILFAFALVAAACGGDDETSTDTGAEEDGGVLGGETATEDTAAEDTAAEDTAAEDTAAEDTAAEDTAASGGGLANDAEHGFGAEYWESVYDAQPGPADESLEPVVITMANIEGTPIGSFPDIREGALAAVKDINENLGGIAGRPVELDVCVHGADPNEATNCANEIVDKQPNLHIQGIDFFNPLMWPTLVGADLAILETVPIFISDFDTAGIISTEGGCVNAFPSGAQYAAEVLESDKVAVIHSDTGPGFECYTDTQERFYQYYSDEIGMEFQGFPDASGDPSDNDAVVQGVVQFFEGAENPSVFFGIQSSDCNEILSSLAAAGVEATIVASGSCRDTAVEANPASVGVHFGSAGKIFERPDLWTEWETKTATARDAAIEAFGPESPKSSFMEVAHDVVMSAWVQMSILADGGSDLSDPAEIRAAFAEQSNLYRHNGPPVNCTNNASEFESVCNKLTTYYVWDGEQYQLGPLEGEYLDVAELLQAVSDAYPRPTA